MTDVALPAYQDLPIVEGGARSGWRIFGPDDSLGLLNLITPEKAKSAAKAVVTGDTFPLDLPSDFLDPPLFSRGAPRRTTIEVRPGAALDDVHDNFFPQAASQWDALGHIAFQPGVFYNGASASEIVNGVRNTIDHVARKGVVTRGVLLDVSATVAERGGAGSSVALTASDLERARRAAGVEIQQGDALLIHTGFLRWYANQDAALRRRMSRRDLLTAPGLAHDEAMAEYLWDAHIAAVIADNPGLEVWPPDERPEAWPFGFLHQIILGQFGLPIGELWWLSELADACREDGRYDFMLVSAPMNAPGGIGSPANALAIR